MASFQSQQQTFYSTFVAEIDTMPSIMNKSWTIIQPHNLIAVSCDWSFCSKSTKVYIPLFPHISNLPVTISAPQLTLKRWTNDSVQMSQNPTFLFDLPLLGTFAFTAFFYLYGRCPFGIPCVYFGNLCQLLLTVLAPFFEISIATPRISTSSKVNKRQGSESGRYAASQVMLIFSSSMRYTFKEIWILSTDSGIYGYFFH